jgi:hypothetical protein
MIWLIRTAELTFFIGIAGCLVTIALSWFLIFKEEFASKE